MMATVGHVISGLGLRKFQADGFFVDTSVQEPGWVQSRSERRTYYKNLGPCNNLRPQFRGRPAHNPVTVLNHLFRLQ